MDDQVAKFGSPTHKIRIILKINRKNKNENTYRHTNDPPSLVQCIARRCRANSKRLENFLTS